ncbi:MAG: hypothetical protein JNG88_13865 [Phycisphaerales bacterium]|nr:hypothetical protein [Phycisphaerales bacterium]
MREQHDLTARVVDLRWLSPLNEQFIIEQSLATRRVLIVDEGRHSGGIHEAIMSLLMERCPAEVTAARLTGLDTYTPLGPSANYTLPTEPEVVRAALELCAAQTAAGS